MESTSQAPKSISAGSLIAILLVGLFLLLLFWFGTQALRGFTTQEEDFDTRRSAERVEIRDRVLEQADADLNRYAWKNQDQGLVQLPIQRAMELTVAALQTNNEIKPAYFIDPLKAAAEQQAATAPAPAEEAIPAEAAAPAEAAVPAEETAPVEAPADESTQDLGEPVDPADLPAS
jgi:hypothetical protein